MAQIVPTPSAPAILSDEDRFRHGWRYETRRLPDGSEVYERVPLTMDDVLHPRAGDHIPENTLQERDRTYLASVIRARLAHRPDALVLSDCLINWGIEGLGNHSPDISVFEGVRGREPERGWGTFFVVREGARPLLNVEVVSPDDRDPRARNNDVVFKVEHYHRAGVPLYVIVDQQREGGSRSLIGYQYAPEGYVRMPPDEQGRLRLEPLGLLVGMQDNRVVCYDAASGEAIGDYTQVSKQLRAEIEARMAAEERLRALEAELHQLRGNGHHDEPPSDAAK